MRQDLRNIAIIAHVDHGKTTLVDALFREGGVFRENQRATERLMDSGELERERGITILAKNAAVQYDGVKINLIDTPGHADFGGEVERILTMVEGALLLVDSAEGPMPQTRYVLRKALEAGLSPLVVVNKMDRADARPAAVIDQILELFMDLGAQEEQLDFPVIYASAREGWASREQGVRGKDMDPLFRAILEHIPSPGGDAAAPLQLQVTTLDHDDYQGRIAIGRIAQGTIRPGEVVAVARDGEVVERPRVVKVFLAKGVGREAVEQAVAGDVVAVTGLTGINIGDTITSPENPVPLPGIRVDEPTLVMTFRTNDSPLVGQEGKYVTSRHLRERLFRELERNVALRVEETDSPDAFRVAGRGELHLSILIETIRREGYELGISKPEVILREEGGARLEPYEELLVEVLPDYVGAAMELIGGRRGELQSMGEGSAGSSRLEFRITSRGLLGLRAEFLSSTRGYGTMHHVYAGYGPWQGEMVSRIRGSIIATEAGETTGYALHNLEDRGVFFVPPGTRVYPGMVVGEYTRESDIEVNVCKKKHATNVRSATAEETFKLATPRLLTLEGALEFIAADELVEVTPANIRVRKLYLDAQERKIKRKG